MSGLQIEGFFVGARCLLLHCAEPRELDQKLERTTVHLDTTKPEQRAHVVKVLREAAAALEKQGEH